MESKKSMTKQHRKDRKNLFTLSLKVVAVLLMCTLVFSMAEPASAEWLSEKGAAVIGTISGGAAAGATILAMPAALPPIAATAGAAAVGAVVGNVAGWITNKVLDYIDK